MGIAFDRYRAINSSLPNRQPRNNMVAMMTIFLIDLVSIILIFPYALNMNVRKCLDISFAVILDSGRYLMELRHVGRTGEETSESALVSSHCLPSSVFPSCVASTSTSRSSTCWGTEQGRGLRLRCISLEDEKREGWTGCCCCCCCAENIELITMEEFCFYDPNEIDTTNWNQINVSD